MTTPLELLSIAEKHKANPGVRVLLTSITENKFKASEALKLTQSTTERLAGSASLEDPSYLGGSTAFDLTAYATQATTYLGRLSSDLMNLACLLESLGENIRY